MRNPEHSPGFGRFGRFGHHGGGGRRRKLFDSDGLRLMILHLIAEEPRHGYDVIRALAARSGGGWSPSPGMVYPLLSMLSEMGLMCEEDQAGSRKRFAVTEAGRQTLSESAEELARLLARLDSLAGDAARVDPSPVRRAMHNLRAVLEERLRRDDAMPETAFAAAALIDGAAQSIERL